MEDYISITSFSHHPFYSQFVLEVQDNWAMQSSYNLPLDEFMNVMEQAIMNGYTFGWGADVSEKGFGYRDALAIIPEDESTIQKSGKDSKRFNDAGAIRVSNAFVSPVKERNITQEDRQIAFDNQETTDDHGMHVTGLVEDQKGTKYLVNNLILSLSLAVFLIALFMAFVVASYNVLIVFYFCVKYSIYGPKQVLKNQMS